MRETREILQKLEAEREKRRKAEKRLKKLEKQYNDSLLHKERLRQNLLGLLAAVNMPRIYLDYRLNIVGFSDDFPATEENIALVSSGRGNLAEFLRSNDIDQIRQYLRKLKALENLPYDSERGWELKYRGPNSSDRIGKSWIALSGCNKLKWEIINDCGRLKFVHKPHIRDRVDCYLMCAEEYGGANEDVKVIYRVKTSKKEENIRDLSLVLSGSSNKVGMLCDAVGYTVCSGSFYNTEARIQRKAADIIRSPEKLKPDTEYEITVERIGGRIRRLLKNLETQQEAQPLEMIDPNALYDRENHLGFTTYSGEAEIYDIEVYTRKSPFSIDRFRIPFKMEVRLKDAGFKDRVFNLRISKDQSLGKIIYTLFFEDITERKRAEEALGLSEEKYRELVENINEVIYSVDNKGVVKYISPIIESISGYKPSEVLGHSFTEFVYQEDIPRVVKRFREILAGDKTPTECRLLAKSNEIRWIRASTKPVLKGNKLIGLQGSLSDITERKQAEEALRESEERYRHLIQNIPVGLYRNTPGPKGKFIMANEATARMHGFEKVEDFLQTPVADLYYEPTKRKIFSDKLIAKGEVFREELLLKKRDGTPFWGAVSARVIRDESGKIKCFDGMLEDITKQKQAEEALQISEERFRNVAEETDDWVWEIGIDLVFKYSNSRVKEILGYEPEEVIGKSFLDFMSEKELYRIESKRDYLLREIIFTGQETYLVRKDGKTIITESSGVPIFRRNRTFVGFQGLTRDITERIQVKEEEERRRQQLIQADKMISLGILVSGVAHEINNPNQFIIVNAPMLKRAWENITPILDRYYEENGDFMLAGLSYTEMRERIPDLFTKICDGSQRIKHIVRNLKDYAREGGSEIAQEVDINAVLQSALTILSNLLKKATKKLKVNYAENLPAIRGNFQRIEQVLINLIQNACQALPDPMKGITITTSHNKKTRKVVVKIKDEGVGIAENHKKYIFDPFFTSKRDQGGTGLGLSISAGIIEEHGGNLEFSSEPGKGTAVSVILPVSHNQ